MEEDIQGFIGNAKRYAIRHTRFVDKETGGRHEQYELIFNNIRVITEPKLKASCGEDVDYNYFSVTILGEYNPPKYTFSVSDRYSGSMYTDSLSYLTAAQVRAKMKSSSLSAIAVKILKENGW